MNANVIEVLHQQEIAPIRSSSDLSFIMQRSESAFMQSTDKINNIYEQEYGKKLELIEQIRHEVNLEDINTPGIVVIGSQSAGKSSVLARLTGISFPSGDNICTRTPTIVQTNTDPNINSFRAIISDHASFENAVQCFSMADLQQSIIDFTNKLNRGSPTSISKNPIHIRHTRRQGPVMTLIDLPGITHFDPINEEFDIHGATCTIVREYVKDDNMIILVVIPATEDFANSEALRIAQQYDPNGTRTIGVVSKCDMVPPNSDILDKMHMNRPTDIKLALGLIAVRNRACHEENENIDLLEEQLFTTHALLRKLKPAERGIEALTSKVVRLQGEAVDRFFSILRTQMWDRKHAMKQQLIMLPNIPKTSDERRDTLIDVLCRIDRKIGILLQTEDVSEMRLNIPACTFELCEKFGTDIISQMPNVLHEDFTLKVLDKQRKGRGRVLPDSEIDTVIGQQVRELLFGGAGRKSSGGVVQRCTEELINGHLSFMIQCYESVINSETDHASFPMLAEVICSELGSFIETGRRMASQTADCILAAEQSICFTQNSLYVSMIREVRKAAATGARAVIVDDKRKQKQNNLNESLLFKSCPLLRVCSSLLPQENIEESDYTDFLDRFVQEAATQSEMWSLMRAQFSIHCYLHVVMKRLSDVIPMVVRNVLVYDLHDGFLSHVSKALSRDPSILEAAMRESPNDKETRETLENRFGKLEDVLTKMRELGLDKLNGSDLVEQISLE